MQDLFKYGQCSLNNIFYNKNDFTYRDTGNSNTRTLVIVVGCGGTGGRIIPLLAQHISNHNKTMAETFNNNLYLKHNLALKLCDMDVV